MTGEIVKTGGEVFVAAIQSVADLGKPAVETGCKLIESLLGEPCRVAGGLLSDQIYAWQWGNRIRIANKAKRILDNRDIPPKILPLGFLHPLLEAAGNIEDEELQEVWARLLASAVNDPERQHPAFISILSQLNSDEAKVIDGLSRHRQRNVPFSFVVKLFDNKPGSISETYASEAAERHPILATLGHPTQCTFYSAHLGSLGLIHTIGDFGSTSSVEGADGGKLYPFSVLLTTWGYQFSLAIHDPI